MKKRDKSSSGNKFNIFLKRSMIKIFLVTILFLGAAIFCKTNTKYKNIIYDNVYSENLSFVKIKKFYNKYLGGIIPFDNLVSDIEPVFNEKLKYSASFKYLEGVKLEVDDNYLVPVIETGMVVYIGEKKGYDNVIIIEGMNGVDTWYGGIETTNVKLYDYVEKGNLLGETKKDYLYLVYSQNGAYLDYEEYLT